MFPREFPQNFDEADDQNQRRTNVNPEWSRRHAKRNEGQSRFDDHELLEKAKDDLQRWDISPSLGGEHSKAANEGNQP